MKKFLLSLSSNFKTVLNRNLFLKLLSLGIALSIWAWVQNVKVAEENSRATILYKWPDGLEKIKEPRQNLTVTLQGPQGLLKAVEEIQLVAVADLSDASEGIATIDLTVSDILKVPVGLNVLRISPPNLEVEFDKPMTKTVNLKPNLVGKPAQGWVIREVRTIPETVTVKGAQSLLASMTEVSTESIELEGLKGNRKFSSKVSLPNSTLRLEKPISIEVEVEVGPLFSQKSFKNIPVEIRRRGKWKIDQQTSEVLLEGPQSELDKISDENLTILLSIPKGLKENMLTLEFKPEEKNKLVTVIHGDSKFVRPVKLTPAIFELKRSN